MAPYLVLFGRAFPTYSLLALAGRRLPGGTSTGGSGAGGRTPAGRSRPSSGGAGSPGGGPSSSTCPQLPQLAADLPCWARTLPCSPPGTSPGVRVLRGLLGPGGRWGSSAGGGSCPSARWGRPGARRPPLPRLWPGGCFLAGCCYGIPRPGGVVGVTFSQALLAPNGGPGAGAAVRGRRVPPPLPAAGPAGPAGVVRGAAAAGLPVPLRGLPLPAGVSPGDGARGFWGPLSTSQWVALATLAVALPVLLWQQSKRNHQRQP